MSFTRKHRVFANLIFLTCFGLPFSAGIKCYECGKLDIIPSTSNSACDRDTDYVPTCRYDLSLDGEIPENSFFISNEIESSWLSNDSITEVCYTLHGTFRGGSLVMRGCDAMEIGQPDMDSIPEDSNTTTRCLDSNFRIWFETEVGKELIQNTQLCICDTDYCNFKKDYGGAAIRKPVLSLSLFSTFSVLAVSGYFMIPKY